MVFCYKICRGYNRGIMIENYEVIIRLFLALSLGAFLGVERIHAGKAAGLRTFALVSMGSALFIIVSEQITARYFQYNIDPLRVASGLVTAIGFLGAGMIVFQKNHVSNLTTAAGMWISSAIGVAVGFGLYLESITTTLLVIFTFSLMLRFERYLKHRFNMNPKNVEIEDTEK